MSGSGYKSFTAGSVLTASDVNAYLMKQSVMYFANAAARDAAITSPERGMMCWLGDSGSLLVYYGATTGWRPSWDRPWGVIGVQTLSTSSSAITGTGDSGLTQSLAFVKDRRYRYTTTFVVAGTGNSGNEADVFITDGSNNVIAGSQARVTPIGTSGAYQSWTFTFVETAASTGTVTRKYRLTKISGTDVKLYATSDYLAIFAVEDIGPSSSSAPTS